MSFLSACLPARIRKLDSRGASARRRRARLRAGASMRHFVADMVIAAIVQIEREF